jgi:hypothetical protein
MQKPLLLIAAAALTLLIGAAPETELAAGGRYTITPAEAGTFLRLDSQTGALSACQRKDGRWACEAVPDDRRALQGEIDRLAGENRELQRELKRLEGLLALPDPGNPESRGARSERGPKFRLPTEGEVDWALDYAERMMRKFKDRLRDFKDSDRRNL